MHRMLYQKNKLTAHKAQAHSATAIHDALIVPQINTGRKLSFGLQEAVFTCSTIKAWESNGNVKVHHERHADTALAKP